MIDDPRTDTASVSAVGSSGTVIVASGRVWSDRPPTETVRGRSNDSVTGSGPAAPLAEISTSVTRIVTFVAPFTSMEYDPRGRSIGSSRRAT
ncbi:hypothetical protein C464_09032 [Halorubrum coriense DSM 10284]|uniref:Uncharacterized protein n=1 Tax=Halorubrum coriense DSM 10284 TaxID=1227466 RepID=M0EJL3_9EURY|nr:hypothetical protein [Halorubrum coriense]ELZ47062.1 hypothetical protein C464_09032 [Halorubrum coriense DSM 10284]